MTIVSFPFFPAASFPPPEAPIPLTEFIALLQRVQASINPKVYPSQLVYGAGGISIEGIREVTEAEVHAASYEKTQAYLKTLEASERSSWAKDDVCALLKSILNVSTATQTPSPKV